jgi:hypothetical protein
MLIGQFKDKRSTSLALPTKRRWRGRQHQQELNA